MLDTSKPVFLVQTCVPNLRQNTGLLLIGHGTRDVAGQAEFRTFAAKVAESVAPQPVEAGFIELAEPSIGEALNRLADRGAERIVVIPLLLFAAGHAKSDVPEAVRQAAAAHSGLRIDVMSPFVLDEHIMSLSERRYTEALAGRPPIATEETYWLLVGRGSSDKSAAEDLARFADERARRSSLARFGHSFVAAAHPTLAEGLAAAANTGVKRIVVQPHLLFRGAVLDEVAAAVNQWQMRRPDLDWITTAHLGPEQELVDAVIDRAIVPLRRGG